jgi:rhamnose utilization protein RhaD (predicted bifunctional aldolase and dehydrogenase)
MTGLRAELSGLAARIGDPREELVIAGEGNVSGRSGPSTLLVSPSGSRLADIDPAAWVEVDLPALVEALDGDGDGLDDSGADADWLARILAARMDPAALRPTVEVALHAVIADALGEEAAFIAHTHPTALLSVLCSPALDRYAALRLFPDHVVALGQADCVLPYVDPGRELARRTRRALADHVAEYGEPPRMLLAAHHGVFVMGRTAQEVLDRTLMAAKAARVVVGAGSLGGALGMPAAEVARIAGREDEHFRRAALAGL